MTKQIIHLLARLGFKQAIQNYAYQHQSKTYKDNLEFAFTDTKGRKYFFFPDMRKLPLPLLEKLNELQEQMACKVPGRDLDGWIECVEKALNTAKPKLSDIGYWINVLKERRTILFEPTVLTEIAALLYIREDENPCVYNQSLHKEKFDMLWADSQNGAKLYDFFRQAGLSSYIPSENISAANWQEYLTEITAKVEQFNSAVTATLASYTKFAKLESSSEKT